MIEKTSEDRQAGPEIEVTPEMIEAGNRIIEGLFPHGSLEGVTEGLAKDVFEGMFCVSPYARRCLD